MKTPATKDDQLISEGLRVGDQKVFSLLFEEHWFELYEIAYRKMQNHEDAQEVVQNLFVEIWEKREKLFISNPQNYLRVSLRNKCIDLIRSRIIQDRYADHCKLFQQSRCQTTQDDIDFKELSERVDKGVGTLPEKSRNIFALSRYEGLSTKEIAKKIKLSEKAVEYHLTKALKILRAHLKEFMLMVVSFFSSL